MTRIEFMSLLLALGIRGTTALEVTSQFFQRLVRGAIRFLTSKPGSAGRARRRYKPFTFGSLRGKRLKPRLGAGFRARAAGRDSQESLDNLIPR
jgi:hypothetical protein